MINDFKEIYEKYIKSDIKLTEMFNAVDLKAKKLNKKWLFEYAPNLEPGILGDTEIDNNYIIIRLCPLEDKEKFKAILIHELGEADYKLLGLPSIKGDYDKISDLPELFSHFHIRRLAEKFKLNGFIDRNLEYSRNFEKVIEKEDWEIITEMVCALITYQDKNDYIEQQIKSLDEGIKKNIYKVVGIISERPEMNYDKKILVGKYKKIIKILKKNGLSNDITENLNNQISI